MPRRSQAAVARTRDAVVSTAVRRASVDGLDGLTIGALAAEARMRKSSLFSLFGSKQDLQLATLGSALQLFVTEVWDPVADRRPGRERLLELCESWIDFHARRVFPGGCFLTTATVEFDAREGPLHDAVVRASRRWRRLLEREVAAAVEAGELPAAVDPADVAFELNAIAAGANCDFQLTGDREALDRALRSMRRVLGEPGATPAR